MAPDGVGRDVFEVKSSGRRRSTVARATSGSKRKAQHVKAPSEMDTHADTTVCGSNCIVLEYTGQVCDVSPFSDGYEATKDIPIATCATAWTDDTSGLTYILVFNQALCFGGDLAYLLINPNQIRA